MKTQISGRTCETGFWFEDSTHNGFSETLCHYTCTTPLLRRASEPAWEY